MVAMALLVGILLSPPPPEVVREAAKRVLEDAAYQKSIPVPSWRSLPDHPDPPVRPETPPRETDRPRRSDAPRPEAQPPQRIRPSSGPSAEPSEPGSPIGRAILWVGLAVLAALGVVYLVRELRGRERDVAYKPSPVAPPPDPDVVTRPLTDAEAFAGRGEFGPAIHALLLQTLHALASKSPVPLPRSLTSREILTAVEIPGEARKALASLVESAEVCHFGGVPAAEPQYAACVGHFRAFAAAYVGAAA